MAGIRIILTRRAKRGNRRVKTPSRLTAIIKRGFYTAACQVKDDGPRMKVTNQHDGVREIKLDVLSFSNFAAEG